jgi:hypothetical protein
MTEIFAHLPEMPSGQGAVSQEPVIGAGQSAKRPVSIVKSGSSEDVPSHSFQDHQD